jgi:acyl-coenzyme A synthetase/AMP-(fatty) acid ligase
MMRKKARLAVQAAATFPGLRSEVAQDDGGSWVGTAERVIVIRVPWRAMFSSDIADPKSFRDGLAIRDRLAKADPGNAGWQRDLSIGGA